MNNDYRPYTLIAELTYRCPLRCPYCSNPLELERAYYGGREPAFQYIVTTTTPPLGEASAAPYVRLTLDARGEETAQ